MEALDDYTFRKRRARLLNPITAPYVELQGAMFGPYIPPPPIPQPFKFQAPPAPPPPAPPPQPPAQPPPPQSPPAGPTPMAGPPPPPITGQRRSGNDGGGRGRRQRGNPVPPPAPPVPQYPMPSTATDGAFRASSNIQGVNTTSFVAMSSTQRAQNISQGATDAQAARIHGMVLRGQLRREQAANNASRDRRPEDENTRVLRPRRN